MQREWAFAVALGCLFLFILLLISIAAIRNTWTNPDTRERGIIFLYVATIAAFFLAFIAFVSAEQTPNACILPYSGKLALIPGN